MHEYYCSSRGSQGLFKHPADIHSCLCWCSFGNYFFFKQAVLTIEQESHDDFLPSPNQLRPKVRGNF